MPDLFYLGIDVGTGSARAAIFDADGKRMGLGSQPIRMWKPQPDFYEQSTDDIWTACGQAVRAALAQAAVSPDRIAGIGFDATCSLVALDKRGAPLTVSPSGSNEQNVIVWMDHRAIPHADRINATGHPVLRFVGDRISPEMELPKLLWLKENMPGTWTNAGMFLDLADFLGYRATGQDVRSLCTTTCKWTYVASESRWDDGFLKLIGLGDLCEENYRRIGRDIRPQGERAGVLTQKSAEELGLAPGIPVAVSIIDAHAGGLGLLGMAIDGVSPSFETLDRRVALIGGTSTCHMAVSQRANFVPGVWGPYYSAMVPGMWLAEGGQSATGALIDHVIRTHPRGRELAAEAAASGTTPYELLNCRLDKLAEGLRFPAELTRGFHVYPDFHGNRSPLADPTLRGMVSGLSLDDGIDSLALLYLATVQAIAMGTRQIIRQMNDHGFHIETIIACGGDTKNRIFLREHADATGCRILLAEEPEAVLLGSAMLGAVASGRFPDVLAAMTSMSRPGRVVEPAAETARYHEAKGRVFELMLQHQRMYSEQMQ
ncbi:MAG TPA: FGGY-family carbohydrate kinase [Clostridia bacterium]|nr:FGGY-family carbohydrate kinase [Clostridia bacterium]